MHRRSLAAAGHLGAWLTLAIPVVAAGQTGGHSGPQPAVCDGRPITAVVVHTAPADDPILPSWLDPFVRVQGALQVTTQPDVVRRFAALTPGDLCSSARLAEAERVLRAQRVFRQVTVRPVDDVGGVRLEIDTQDESNVAFAPYLHAGGVPLRGGKVGALNLGGTARVGEVECRSASGYPDVMGVRYVDRLFGGHPEELQLRARRTVDGYDLHAGLARPIYTASQRVAFLVSADHSLGFAPLRRPEEAMIAVPVAQTVTMVGATRRFLGPQGEQILGLTLASATLDATGSALQPSALGFVVDSGTPVAPAFRIQRVARVNLLAGLDRTQFVAVRGLDALTAVQDVRVGSQWSVQLGQAVPVGSLRDRDQFVAVDGYAGTGGARAFGAVQVRGEARRDLRTNRWDGQVVSGRGALYLKPQPRFTSVLSVEAGGGWRVQSPFQLSLADLDGGLVGYRRSMLSGGRRALVQAEQRVLLPPGRVGASAPLDLGLAVFAQAGRLWADPFAPYSTSTSWQPVVGIGLLAAPAQARRLYRLDIGLPIVRGVLPESTPQRVALRLVITDRTRSFWREPRDVAAGREATHPGGLVSWP